VVPMKFEMVISLKTPRSLGLKDVSAVRAHASAELCDVRRGATPGGAGCSRHRAAERLMNVYNLSELQESDAAAFPREA
jgi:hypothetical protein